MNEISDFFLLYGLNPLYVSMLFGLIVVLIIYIIFSKNKSDEVKATNSFSVISKNRKPELSDSATNCLNLKVGGHLLTVLELEILRSGTEEQVIWFVKSLAGICWKEAKEFFIEMQKLETIFEEKESKLKAIAIIDFIKTGKRNEAIKLFCEYTNLELFMSKKIINELEYKIKNMSKNRDDNDDILLFLIDKINTWKELPILYDSPYDAIVNIVLSINNDPRSRIKSCIEKGNKIEAIKLIFREYNRVDLSLARGVWFNLVYKKLDPLHQSAFNLVSELNNGQWKCEEDLVLKFSKDVKLLDELEWCSPGYSPAQYQQAIEDTFETLF